MRSSNTHLQPKSWGLVVEFKIGGPPVDSLLTALTLQVIDQPFSKRKLERDLYIVETLVQNVYFYYRD